MPATINIDYYSLFIVILLTPLPPLTTLDPPQISKNSLPWQKVISTFNIDEYTPQQPKFITMDTWLPSEFPKAQ